MGHFGGRTYCGRSRGTTIVREKRVADSADTLETDGSIAAPGGAARLERGTPTHEQIAQLAHSYWQARGCQGGSDVDDWLRAETELKLR